MQIPSKLLVSALVACALTQAHGANARGVIQDPVKDYLSQKDLSMLSHIEASKSILNISLDVNNNGKPWILVTVPDTYTKTLGYVWTPYIPVPGGYTKVEPSEGGTQLSSIQIVFMSVQSQKSAFSTDFSLTQLAMAQAKSMHIGYTAKH